MCQRLDFIDVSKDLIAVSKIFLMTFCRSYSSRMFVIVTVLQNSYINTTDVKVSNLGCLLFG